MVRPLRDNEIEVGPCIGLEDGQRAWNHPDDLSFDAKASLRELLLEVKQRIIRNQDVTDEELDCFLLKIFDDWKAGDHLDIPSTVGTKPNPRKVLYKFGTLAQTAIASFHESGVRAPTREDELTSWVAIAPRSERDARQQGRPVRMEIAFIRNTRGYTPSEPSYRVVYKDVEGRLFSHLERYNFSDTNGNEEEAFVTVMRLNDKYSALPKHSFNMKMACYIARNRITHWANGNVKGTIPFSERIISALMRVPLCRNEDEIEGVPEGALRTLQLDPAPQLFPST